MVSRNTLVCVGLDPNLTQMPFEITNQKISDEEKVYEFIRASVDVTAQHVCVYKAQKAYFDVLRGGHEVLKGLIGYIHETYPGLPVILDCKIGDTHNTMQIYIKNLFYNLKVDGVVVNPLMGDDAIMPLADFSEKAIVVLVQTSNPMGSLIQNVTLQTGFPFWMHVLDLVVNRWNHNKNIIPVLSSNSNANMSEIRSIIPDDMLILLAGIGEQGGSYANLRNLLNKEKAGVFVNSSRGILYPPENQKAWSIAIEKSVIKLKNELNKEGGRIE